MVYAIIVVEFSAGFGWSSAIERFLEKEKFSGRKIEWLVQRGWVFDDYTLKGEELDVKTCLAAIAESERAFDEALNEKND